MKISINDHPLSFWLPIFDIFENEYWTRLWIQQEVLAARRIVVHCRNSVLEAEGLLRFQSGVIDNMRSIGSGPGWAEVTNYANRMPPALHGTLARGRHRHKTHAGKDFDISMLELYQMLIRGRHFRVTDARDRVYGCLGLLSDDVVQYIKVDYSLSPVEVYAIVYQGLIETVRTLDFLCFFEDGEPLLASNVVSESEVIPSWLPTPDISANCHMSVTLGPPGVPVPGAILLRGRVLSVKALHVDTVKLASQFHSLDKDPLILWFREMDSLYEMTDAPREDGDWTQDPRVLECLQPHEAASAVSSVEISEISKYF
jgi:hypothetical protein